MVAKGATVGRERREQPQPWCGCYVGVVVLGDKAMRVRVVQKQHERAVREARI